MENIQKHYFIDLKTTWGMAAPRIEAGYFTRLHTLGFVKKTLVVAECTQSSVLDNVKNVFSLFFDTLDADISAADAQKNDTLLYIHGMWCDFPPIHSLNLKHFESHYLLDEQLSFARTVSILYHVHHPFYPVNHRNTEGVATALQPFFAAFCAFFYQKQAETTAKMHVLCHSMGNQILAHLVSKTDFSALQNPAHHATNFSHSEKLFGKVIMAAPDVDTDVFDAEKPLAGLPDLAEKVLIYVSRSDFPLVASSILHRKKRLGRHGISAVKLLPRNVFIADVSALRDNQGWHARANRHIYYHASPTVVRDIRALFLESLGDNAAQRRVL